MKMQEQIWLKVIAIAIVLLSLGSCSGTKHLEEGDLVLVRNTFDIKNNEGPSERRAIMTSIAPLIRQQPVRKSLLNVRTWSKPLTKYDRSKTAETAEAIEQFLKNKKGYYHVEVDYKEIAKKDRHIEVVYQMDMGTRYTVRSISYSVEDSTILQLITGASSQSFIAAGEPLDATKYDQERARLVSLLKDEGYASFNSNYIEYRGDSSQYEVDVIMHIYNPVDQSEHTRYTVGDINVYTEHAATQNPQSSTQDTINGHIYHARGDHYLVNPWSIDQVIAVQKGNRYNLTNERHTNNNLTRLAPYRFAVVSPQISAEDPSVLDYNIFLTPQNKKWVMDSGLNLFYSSVNTQAGQTLLGFSGGVNFQNRNFANRAITHTIGLEGTLEFNFPKFPRVDSVVANTVSFQLSNRFDIPKVVDILRVTRLFKNVGLITDESYKNIRTNGTTTANLSANYTSIANFYELISLNGTWTYNFQPRPNLRYNIRQIGINVLLPNIQPQFRDSVLIKNPLLAKSFERYLLSGLIFRELSVVRRTAKSEGGSQFVLLGTLEQSGAENLLINRLVNLLSSRNGEWEVLGTKISDYVRLEGDIRYYKDVLPRSSFAARLNLGLALPYNGDVVPYIKQYYVGGPNSIRGWQLREIVGGHREEVLNGNFFQTGNIKLDFSAEYRFDLFWYLEGAVFLDGGNVWLLKKDEQRPLANFTTNALSQTALATGWGLRLDFDYFIFRFDFGYKLRNPIPDEITGSRWVLLNKSYNNSVLGNVSFAINYPF